MTPEITKERSFTTGIKKRLVYAGIFMVGAASAVYSLYGTHVNEKGEGWRTEVSWSDEGLKFRYIIRSRGGRPAPCRPEAPLTPTLFMQKEYSINIGRRKGYEEMVSEYVVGARYPADLCSPIEW